MGWVRVGAEETKEKDNNTQHLFCRLRHSVLYSLCIRAVSGPAAEPDSEFQKDEEEGEDSLLSDAEEMDLLGEIFDTLSSRSSHERGLLYGTRSLDLFGPDSHDYIMKVRR